MLEFDSFRFKLTLCFILMVCFVMAQSKENSEKDKKGIKRKSGYVRMKPEKSKGKQMMEIEIDGQKEDMEIEEQKLPLMSKPPSKKKEDVKMYLSKDKKTACMEECNRKTTKCDTQCLRHTENSYTYVSGNHAMNIESNASLTKEFNFTTDILNQRRAALQGQANPTNRKKREAQTSPLVVPNIDNHTARINVRLLISHEVIESFQEVFVLNATEAMAEVEYFLTLAMNTVEMYFATITDWGFSFNTNDGVNKPMDMAVFLEDIDFPQIVDNKFVPIEPIINSEENGFLVSKIYFQFIGGFYYYRYETGLLIEMTDYMRRRYQGTTIFNHLQLITEYGLAFEYWLIESDGSVVLIFTSVGVVGFVPVIGAVCENYAALNYDLRFSVVSLYAPEFVRVMAHEIGHIVGAYHDQDGNCDDEIYIMNPINYPKFPGFSDSYYKFSNCSVDYIKNYLAGFTSGELGSCVYTAKPTENEFLSKFCKGFLGNRYNISFHCQYFVDTSSFICPSGDYTFENEYLPSDGCEIKEVNNRKYPVFWCANEGDCENTTAFIASVFEGTKCLNEDGSQGDKVCYKGKCQTELEICEGIEWDDEEENENESEE